MNDIAIGSFIAVNRRTAGVTIHKIVGETATQWKAEHDIRFKKSDLSIVGASGRWDAKYGRKATEDDFLAKRILEAQYALSRIVVTRKNLEIIEGLISSRNDAIIGNG